MQLDLSKYSSFCFDNSFLYDEFVIILNDPILYRTITHNIGTLIIQFYTKYLLSLSEEKYNKVIYSLFNGICKNLSSTLAIRYFLSIFNHKLIPSRDHYSFKSTIKQVNVLNNESYSLLRCMMVNQLQFVPLKSLKSILYNGIIEIVSNYTNKEEISFNSVSNLLNEIPVDILYPSNKENEIISLFYSKIQSEKWWIDNIQVYWNENMKKENDFESIYKFNLYDHIIPILFQFPNLDVISQSLLPIVNALKQICENPYESFNSKLYLLYILSNILRIYNEVSDSYKNYIRKLCKDIHISVIEFIKTNYNKGITNPSSSLSPYLFVPVFQLYQINSSLLIDNGFISDLYGKLKSIITSPSDINEDNNYIINILQCVEVLSHDKSYANEIIYYILKMKKLILDKEKDNSFNLLVYSHAKWNCLYVYIIYKDMHLYCLIIELHLEFKK